MRASRANAVSTRFFRWLPLLVLAGISAAFFSPLGVVVAIFLGAASAALLDRFGLTVQSTEVGGPALRSATSFAILHEPPSGDVELDRSELGMGGPSYFVHMLRDGAIVTNVSTGWHDTQLPGIRLGLVCNSRRSESLAVYDENLKQLGIADDPSLADSYFRICAGAESESSQIARRALAAASFVKFHSFRGLWLSQDHAAIAAPPVEWLQRTLRSGRRLSARLLLPTDLRGVRAPHLLAASPPYELYLDGVSTGRHVFELGEAWESDDGQYLVVRGARLDEHLRSTDGLWHVFTTRRWTAFRSCISGEKQEGDRGFFPLYETRVCGVSNDGKIVLEAYRSKIEEGGRIVVERLNSSTISLLVEWRVSPLQLRVRCGRFVVQVPVK